MIEYSEYLVLSERDSKNFKGDYRSFCNFKEVLELAENISRKQIDTYLYMDEHYKLPITLVELKSNPGARFMSLTRALVNST